MKRSNFGTVVIVSENPMHDTGGGQRSAQLALEFLDRGFSVLFLARGEVTETVDLGIHFEHEALSQVRLSQVEADPSCLDPFLGPETLVITQVPTEAGLEVLRRARARGATTLYDLVDLWDSELGTGWYTRRAERRVARSADVLIASAPSLALHLERITSRAATVVPNAFRSKIFVRHDTCVRPGDLPSGRIALYVGALWGGWFDWSLVRSLAASLPSTQFVFVGDYRGEGGVLPDNCRFLGLRPQVELPSYLAHADIGFLPWKDNRLTQATSPLKVYEFIAMGLPVVAPETEPLRDIPGVLRARDAHHFESLLVTMGRSSLDSEIIGTMRHFARDNSWTQRVDALLELAAANSMSRINEGVRPSLWARLTGQR